MCVRRSENGTFAFSYFEDHKTVFQNNAVDAARKALVKKAKKLKDCERALQKQEVVSQLSPIRKQQFKNIIYIPYLQYFCAIYIFTTTIL